MKLELIKIAITTPLFLYAMFSDYKNRRVSDKIWIPLVVLGIILIPINFGESYLYKLFVSIGAVVPLVFLLLYFDFGGADAKFLLVLALLFPIYPDFFDPIYLEGWVFALTVLLNALILALVYPIALFLVNVKRRDFGNPLKMMTALKKPRSEVGEDEKVLGNTFFSNPRDTEKKKYLWVSPKIPFIIPLVAGYFVAIFYGDIWLSLIFV